MLRPSRVFLLSFCLLMVLVSGISVASAQELISGDLRINQVAHFGGDALYCVDNGFIATTSYPDTTTDGGFRLLNSQGQELWFVPADLINAAVAEAKATGKGVLVAEGRGSFGPVALYTYVIGDVEHFVFTGYDEFGKPNSLDFTFCTPVGPNPEVPAVVEEPCEPPKKLVTGAETTVDPCCYIKPLGFGKLTDEVRELPCCLNKPANWSKLTTEVSGPGIPCCIGKRIAGFSGSFDPCDCKVLAASAVFYRNVQPRNAC
jgi:hypothetical protein